MTGSTKILTVSYGTFSCTLEGFDDPFETMRGIAEYFRDLAADDRFFGAEPPTPDVETIQALAQSSAVRRVAAERKESGIALRQVEEAEETTTARPPRSATAFAAPHVGRKGTEIPQGTLDSGPLALDDEYLMADEPEDVLAVDPTARAIPSAPAESVAEKLRRIRAVVSRSIEEEGGEPLSESQAQDAPSEVARKERATTKTIEGITADLSDADEIDLTPEQTPFVETADVDDGWTGEVAGDDTDFEEDEPESVGDDIRDAIVRVKSETAEAEPEAKAESAEADLAPTTETSESEVMAEERDELSAADVRDELTPPEVREGAEDAGDEAVSDTEIAPTEDVQPDDGRDAEIVASVGRRLGQNLQPIEEDNGDVGRLLDETDSKLNEDESVRRRRVISQMRAAVAATKADRMISRRVTSKEVEEAEEQSPYRADLSDATLETAPRRPMTRLVAAPQPAPSKAAEARRELVEEKSEETGKTPSAPLVLVSSQRVDVSEIDDAADEGEADVGTESFAGFARSMGARQLTELLEAAAAYTTFVEGQSSFTRPEIMKRVARLDPAMRLTREDGLRSFGQLLRQGRLKKIERGQFAIAPDTRFNPEQRFAGE